jgi:hypothetical protein
MDGGHRNQLQQHVEQRRRTNLQARATQISALQEKVSAALRDHKRQLKEIQDVHASDSEKCKMRCACYREMQKKREKIIALTKLYRQNWRAGDEVLVSDCGILSLRDWHGGIGIVQKVLSDAFLLEMITASPLGSVMVGQDEIMMSCADGTCKILLKVGGHAQQDRDVPIRADMHTRMGT